MIRKTIWVDPALWKRARIVALENSEPFWKFLRRALEREIEYQKIYVEGFTEPSEEP